MVTSYLDGWSERKHAFQEDWRDANCEAFDSQNTRFHFEKRFELDVSIALSTRHGIWFLTTTTS